MTRADLGIIGDLTNTGQFHIAPLGGIVQVDGHFVSSGAGGFVLIAGGGMELIGDLGGGTANFTNNATNATGLSINTNRFLVADTITNGSGAYINNLGRLEGRDAIINNGTINSNAATSILKGNVTNNGTINAQGAVDGNAATSAFNVTGNLA